MRATCKRDWVVAAGVVLLLAFAGCSDKEVSAPDEEGQNTGQVVDLDDEFGGFLPTDESPAFGDAELASSTGEEVEVENGYEGLSEERQRAARRIEEQARGNWYCFSALWGALENGQPNDDTGPAIREEVIWDGSLQMSRGGVRLLSLLQFEDDEGDQVLPRTEPDLIEWLSRTHDDADGLRLLLVVPPDSSGGREPLTVVFAAGAYQRTFTEAELDSLNETIPVSENASICFRSFKADPAVTVRGAVHGFWGRADGDSVGSFMGRWVGGHHGRLMGWVRGRYGVNSSGEQVFFGKYIDVSGRFNGFVRGRYSETVFERPGRIHERGEFWGEWVARDGTALGRLQGTWRSRGNERGRFHGLWRGHLLTP